MKINTLKKFNKLNLLLPASMLVFTIILAIKIVQDQRTIHSLESRLTDINIHQEPEDAFSNYVDDLDRYDQEKAYPLKFPCFNRQLPTGLSDIQRYGYEVLPPIPDNPELDKIKQTLPIKGSEILKVCKSPIANDYLVITDQDTISAKLYRFNQAGEMDVFSVSTRAGEIFDAVKWLDNGDLIYSVGGLQYRTVYVFTHNNIDILLELCSIEYEHEGPGGANFLCKSFNEISNSSKYLPDSDLDRVVGRYTY